MTLATLGNVLGIFGALAVLAGYAYQTIGKRPADVAYYLLNLIGALLLAGSLTIHVNVASLTLNVIWAGIALYGLIGAWRIAK